MSTALAPQNGAGRITPVESALANNDLSQLATEDRLQYLKAVCDSLNLNPLTRPFQYITLNGKLTLYATRDCADQLRKIHRISIQISDRQIVDGVLFVTARATDPGGRTDESTGAVNVDGLKGEARANAYMKAETKSKRRVTLSICGLGILDETEIDSIPGAQRVDMRTGEVLESRPAAIPATTERVAAATEQQASYASATVGGSAPTQESHLERFKRLWAAAKRDVKDGAAYIERVLGHKAKTSEDWQRVADDFADHAAALRFAMAAYSETGADPDEEKGQIMRIEMSRILDREVTSRKDCTAAELRRFAEACRKSTLPAEAQQAVLDAEVVEEDPFGQVPEHPRSALANGL